MNISFEADCGVWAVLEEFCLASTAGCFVPGGWWIAGHLWFACAAISRRLAALATRLCAHLVGDGFVGPDLDLAHEHGVFDPRSLLYHCTLVED